MSAATPPASSRHQHDSYGADGEGWVRPERASADAVVFVHGFTGHFHETWTWKPPFLKRLWRKDAKNLLGDLLTSEDDLSCDYYSFGHSAGIFDVAATQDLSTALRTFLDSTVASGWPERRVILVSHSLGGVVCRQMILDQLDPGVSSKSRIVGLLMMGTPNLGTDIARLAPSRSGRDLKPWETYLQELNRGWLRRVVNGGDPDLEPEQRARPKCGVLYGLRDRVVPVSSAAAGVYLGELHAVNKGHIELPKCESKKDPTYQVLKQFIVDCQTEASRGPLRLAANALSYRTRRRVLDPKFDWTGKENELIELEHHEPLGPGVLTCKITSTRTGVELRNEVVICLSLDGNAPKNVPIDYSYLFGKGMLTEDEYIAIGDSLRKASLKKEDFEKLLAVKVRLIATDAKAKREIHLTHGNLENGPGYALLRYQVPPEARLMGHSNVLELSLVGTVLRRQGWYGFRSTRTVVEEVELQLIAPFRVYLVSDFWWCAAREEEGSLGKQRFSSKITIPGPLPVGALVIWFFNLEVPK